MEYEIASIASSMLSAHGANVISRSDEEVDFFIHYLASFKLFGHTIYLTTTNVCTFIVMVVLLTMALIIRIKLRHPKEIPDGIQNVAELLVETLEGLVNSNMGKHGKKYVNYIGTIFLFILLSNISGLFGLRPPTADYCTTFCLALITFIMIQYNNVKYNKLGAFTDLFKPLPFLFPINLIGELATPISLSLRLFGNVMAGTVMLALYYGLLPWFMKLGIPSFLHVYFDLFSGAIQAYVFSMLTMVFVTQKIEG